MLSFSLHASDSKSACRISLGSIDVECFVLLQEIEVNKYNTDQFFKYRFEFCEFCLTLDKKTSTYCA